MTDKTYDLNGTRIYECSADGPPPRTRREATDLISVAWSEEATLVVIPVARLGDDFFRLKTGIAGEIVSRFVTCRLRLAIVGDISRYVEESAAFRDFVYEANKGRDFWFVPDMDSLTELLAQSG